MTFLLYLVVSVSGACVLALEILGTRVLGPFYGVSIYLWSALISITLAALSLGYLIGGRIADRAAGWKPLGLMLGSAGIWVLLIPLLRSPVIDLASGMGLRAAVLLAAAILFAPPLTALGMVSPTAIRIKAASLGEVGTTAGDLYAISTIASVVAAVATGFWLVPQLGVNGLLSGIGGALLLSAGLCFGIGRKVVAAALAMALGVAGLLLPLPEAGAAPGLVARVESPYGSLQVVDYEGVRYMLIDGGTHTALGISDGESHLRYTPVLESAQLLFDQPGSALLLGLGGGVVARDLHEDGWTIESVEIDERVADLADEYFALPPMHSVHIADARRFLVEDERRWDLMIMDAFGSSSVPFHLVTREMFELVRQRLFEDGVLALNVECRQWNDPLIHALAATLRTSFAHVWALPIAEPPNTLGNVVLVASNREGFEFPDDRLGDMGEAMESGDPFLHWYVVQQNHAWANRFEAGVDRGTVLTDDRSPVAIWAEQVNLQSRRWLHEFFGDEVRVW